MVTRVVEITYRICDRCGAKGDDNSKDHAVWAQLNAHHLDGKSLTPGRGEVDLCGSCARKFCKWFTTPKSLAVPARANGGLARAAVLTAEQRVEIARKGAVARWENG